MNSVQFSLLIVLFPLLGAVIAGFFRKTIGRIGAHSVTIIGVALSFGLSVWLASDVLSGISPAENLNLYTWASGGIYFPYVFHIGFLIDNLTVVMMCVVTFVSLLVHIYSIGYMAEDEGYQRFFSYISLFTFMMLMLVTANNFLQLFFGWEGVGLVSYLLIGFWYQKESALQGSFKAFLVNRVGDFGFILGLGLILTYVGSLDYETVFRSSSLLSHQKISLFPHTSWSVVTLTCILLFVGAMGKSAQVPLHVWLPESMEGPTPISALIHAATMVTAGVFMMARISPLIESSTAALSVVLVVGATGAFFTGLIAIVMNDIKRVVAYSTLSQLGYMMVAMGASAYNAGIFHLVTHACFKALLFLGAGSVIIAMHHEQDMRKMGGLYKKMPITYITFLIGSLALCAVPPFAGFFSKDTIIEAVKLSQIPGGSYAYLCVLLGACVTAVYTFRAFFMTFHGAPRMDSDTYEHIKESPWVVWLPLVLLAIPSVILGMLLYHPMLFAHPTLLGNAIMVLPDHDVLSKMTDEALSVPKLMMHSVYTPVFWLTIFGIGLSGLLYKSTHGLPDIIAKRLSWIYRVLISKFGFDWFNEKILMRGTKELGQTFYHTGDQVLIDGLLVNGTGKTLQWAASKVRLLQTGYLNNYVTWMVAGVMILMGWLLF